jgi:hypothetical protein
MKMRDGPRLLTITAGAIPVATVLFALVGDIECFFTTISVLMTSLMVSNIWVESLIRCDYD